MYGRNRYSRYRGNWYQSAFWLVVGILIGQFFRFNITFEDSERTQATAQSPTHPTGKPK